MSLLKDKIELEVAEAELETGKFLKGFPVLLRWIFILAVLSIIPAYYIAKSVSHGLWQQRLNAMEISAHSSFKDPKAPKISAVSLIANRPGEYTAVATVENQNLDLCVKQLGYEFRFYDKDNHIISVYPGKLYLLPDQKKYVIEPNVTSLLPISRGELVLEPNIRWQKKINLLDIKLTSTQPLASQQQSPPAFVVDGSFTNNTPYNLGSVRVSVVVRDRSGQIAAASVRTENAVPSGKRRDYKLLWPQVYITDAAKVEAQIETDVLDKTNITVPAGSSAKDPASDLSRPEKRPNGW